MASRTDTPVVLRRLAEALDGPGGPRPGDGLLVAASGGADSTALLAALAELAPPRRLRLTAGHVDHALRGAESTADRARAEALAGALGVSFHWRCAPVHSGADLEARARRARYRALAALADGGGAARIVTGHTRDDQVETVLLRLLRGAGRGGLGGMRPRRGRLWRPLLGVTRADVRRFLAERDLTFAVDRSNADLHHARNRVRRLLVPFLEAEFNPRLGAALAALATRLGDEEDFLAAAAAARAAALGGGHALDVAVAAEPPALGRRIVRTWLGGLTGRAVGAAHVERILALAHGAQRGSVAVPGPARVLREGDRLWCRGGRAAVPARVQEAIVPGGRVRDPAGRWELHLAAPRPVAADELAAAGPGCAVFDADLLPANLVVRSPVPGDRVHVMHVGTRKLQDVLVDARVPREARADVPLLVGGGEVLWVAGVVRGSGASLGPATRRVVVGVLERRG